MSFVSSVKSLVVIDSNVNDYQSLIQGVASEHEVIVLNCVQDGVQQITEALRGRPSINSLHIVSHGSPGTLYLGNGELSLANLDRYAEDVRSWSVSSILLYGCNVAAGDAGEEFVGKLHALTGAAIAASTTPIGNTALGRNWKLDYQDGTIESEVAISELAQASYAFVLGVVTITSENGTFNFNDGSGNVLTLSSTPENAFYSSAQWGTGPWIRNGGSTTLTFAQPVQNLTIRYTAVDENETLSTSVPFDSIASIGIMATAANGNTLVTFSNTTIKTGAQDFTTTWNGPITSLTLTQGGESSGYIIDLSTMAPAPAAVFSLTPESDTGISQTDKLTRDTTPTFTGTTTANYTIKVFSDGNLLGTTTADGNGDWTFTVSDNLSLAEGVYSITTQAISTGGVGGQVSSPTAITIDTTAPGAPSAAMTLASGDDTGISNSDRITSKSNVLTFSGNLTAAEDGFTVKLYKGTTLLGQGTVGADGAWSATTNVALTEGSNSITYTVTDKAGNESQPSSALPVTILTTPPSLSANSIPDLDAGSDSGALNDDNKTNVTTPLFKGTLTVAEAGYKVTLYDGNTSVGTGTVQADGSWSVTTSTLSAGTRAISYTLTDKAGNESAKSNPLSVDLNTTKPATPVTAADLTDTSDTGVSHTDNLTGDNTPTFTGSLSPADAGNTIKIYDGSSVVGSGTVLSDGTWEVTTSGLTNGSHSIKYSVVEATYGNESNLSPGLTVNINAVIPAAPTSAADLIDESDTGLNRTDNITADTTPTFSGTGIAGQIVRIYDGDNQVGEGMVDGEGNWSVTTDALSVGDRSITTTFVDAETGNESLRSPALLVKIDPKAVVSPTIDPTNSGGSTGSGGSTNNNGGLTNNNKPGFGGIVEPGSTIEILANGQPVAGTATVNDDGSWSFTPSTPLPDGTYKMVVKSTSSNAGTTLSPETPLVIDTKPATVSIVDTLSGLRDTSTNSLTIKFSEAVKNVDLSDLNLTLGGQPVNLQGATLIAKDTQTWVLGNLPSAATPSGEYKISVKPGGITDLAGNTLAVGTTNSWITGYTSDALPTPKQKGKLGVRLVGGKENNQIKGSKLRDTLRGYDGGDYLSGGQGSDKLLGGNGDDYIVGGAGNDIMQGGKGDDKLYGWSKRDILRGNGGDDLLSGDAGDDILYGGMGKDKLMGKSGKDTYAMVSIAEKGDTVVGFNASEDLIDLRDVFKAPQYSAENRFAQYYQYTKLVQVGSNTEVQIDLDGKGAGTTMATLMTLQGVNASSIQSTNFVVG